MPATKTTAEPQSKAAPATTLAQQPALPEKRGGPMRPGPLQRAAAHPPPDDASAMLMDPGVGGAGRARAMRAMQGSMGNARVSRMLETAAPRVQRACACGDQAGPDGECAACKAKRMAVQRQASEPTAPDSLSPITTSAIPSGAGQPLDQATRGSTQQTNNEITKPPLQTKLVVGPPGDTFEQEADAAASQITAGRKAERISRLAGGIAQSLQPEASAQSPPAFDTERAASAMERSGGGSPLNPPLRAEMEQDFGADFSGVRVHTGTHADEATGAVNARAFTRGSDIYLARSESSNDQRLMAHELTHVVQQNGEQLQRAQPQAKERSTTGGAPSERVKGSLNFLSTPATLQRAPGDFLDDLGKDIEDLGKGLAKEAEEGVRQELRALGALPGTGAVFTKSGCPKNFCNPFADVSQAKVDLALVAPVLLAGIAKVVSPRVVPLWKDHLFGGSGPQNLTASFGKDFTGSKRTETTALFIRDQMRIEIAANHKKILTSTGPVTVDLTPRMPKTLAAIDKQGNPHAMVFNKIDEVAGNIAGGIGKDQLSNPIGAKPSPFDDDRTATIAAELTRTATGIKVKPKIVFTIHDTIDLCPGDCGLITEQDATIPLSRFEATGLSGDVPFEVEFPAPASALSEFDIPIAGQSPVKPKGGTKPKVPGKGKAPSKAKGTGKTSALSDFEPPKEPLALEEVHNAADSLEDAGQDFILEDVMEEA